MVPRPLIKELDERVDYKGSVLVRLDPAQVEKAVAELESQGVEALAVSLIWSVANDSHERARRRDRLQETTRTYSSAFPARWRRNLGEYERTGHHRVQTPASGRGSRPTSSGWEAGCGSGASTGEPLIMQSYGGVLGVEAHPPRNAIGTIESGPAAGVAGSAWLGEPHGPSRTSWRRTWAAPPSRSA